MLEFLKRDDNAICESASSIAVEKLGSQKYKNSGVTTQKSKIKTLTRLLQTLSELCVAILLLSDKV